MVGVIALTQLVCPMCGKFCSYNFSPIEDQGIFAVEMKGLCRGKGVKVVDRYSILDPDNEVVTAIGNRLLTLLTILVEEGCLDPDDVYEALPEEDSDEVIDEYVDETEELQERLAKSEKLVEELTERMIK